MRKKTLATWVAVPVLGFVLAGCGDDAVGPIEIGGSALVVDRKLFARRLRFRLISARCGGTAGAHLRDADSRQTIAQRRLFASREH